MELGGGASRTVEKVSEAHALLTKIEEFHHRRIEALGKAYELDKPAYSSFYHDLIDRGLSSSFVKMFALQSNDGVIAAAFSLLHGSCCTTVRLAHAGGKWSKASPGILLASEIVKWAIENHMTAFDFGIGEYDYKQRLGCQPFPLLRYATPMNIKGRLALLAYDGKTFLRN
jgi:CelD/BcsL family acetyltransferase involved in cellulose biosynthesis